jgi:hypothetical protein
MNNNDLLTCFILFVLVYLMRENICDGNRLVEGLRCTSDYGCPKRDDWHHCGHIGGVGNCVSNAEADEQHRKDGISDPPPSWMTKWCTIM